MMSPEAKFTRIKNLQSVVTSRWFLHAGIVFLGLIQKIIGVAQFDLKTFLLIFITYSYNIVFYLYLKRDPNKLSDRGLHFVAILQVVLDQLIITVVMYATGGIESLSFLFYFLSIFMGIIIFSEVEIIIFTLFTVVLYVGVIWLEFQQIIPHISRYTFDPGFYRNFTVTLHNTATVVLIFVFSAFFAAFINNIIRSREAEIVSERDKVIAILNNLIDGILMLDPTGRVILMNPYAKILLNIGPKTEFNDLLLPQKFSEPLQPLIRFINHAAALHSHQTSEIVLEGHNQHVVLQTTVLPIHEQDGDMIGSVAVLHNITRERDLDQVKSDFISIAAHQLRTPLSTLKWLFKLMLDGDSGALSPKQQDLLQKGYERNDEVIEIVNNLLDISEMEEGRFAYKYVDASLNELVQQVVTSSQMAAQRKGIKLEYTPVATIPAVKIDRQKIKMAIQNLIDNAIKYSPDHSVINLVLQVTNKTVVLSIQDHGIGMSAETKEKLFVKFFRGKEAVTKETTGSGLGLYIVRNIVEKHDGTVDFTSEIDQGTTFYIRLPLTKAGE